MPDATAVYPMPEFTTTAAGEPRQVGVEFEFSGLSLDEVASCVQQGVGGEIERVSAAERSIILDDGSRYSATIDWDYLMRTASAQENHSEWLEGLSSAAALLVPMEVVCPPLPIDRLHELDALTHSLRAAGARGTQSSMIAAYGLHLNVEPPAQTADTLNHYLLAFALLQWWLVEAHAVDTTRRLSPYVDLFPEGYVARLISHPASGLEQLMDDYLADNASRNRALDLLPLLSEFDPQRVAQAVDDVKIKSRPALHYRLPNCEIDRPDWSVREIWDVWLIIERLANDVDARTELADAFHLRWRPVIGLDTGAWKNDTRAWLQKHEWV